jgi:hypothetical protein
MPNWCSNNLTLRHKDTAKLNEAIAAFEDGRFFQHFVPLPDGKWDYGFCCENWGTKWDAGGENSVVSALGNNTYSFNFDTAWSPPIEVYRAMREQGFDVVATYYEPGIAFVGKWDNGVDDCYEYGGETSATVRDLIGPELDDEYGISESMADWEDEQDLEELREEYKFPPHTD